MFRISAAIGIDISSSQVRAALIEKRGGSSILQSLISIPFNGAALETILARLKKELNKTTKLPWFMISHQILSIPQSSVAVRRFSALPEKNDTEQFTEVGLQLSESLSLSIDEMLYDYRYVDDEKTIEAFACRRSQIEPTLNALETTGYKLSVIELQSQALMRLFQQHLAYQIVNGTSLLIDIGSERVQLCFDDGQGQHLTREIPLPSETDGQLTNDKHLFTERLAEGVTRQYQLTGTSFSDRPVQQVFLSGEGTKLLDILLLEQKLNWDVHAINPLSGLSYSDSLFDNLFDTANAWSTAIGLALREMQ